MSRSSTRKGRPVVGLAVGPELLLDTLGRVLADRGLEVVRLPSAKERAAPEPRSQEPLRIADVAVVCGEAHVDTPADVVVCLPKGDLDAWKAETEVLVMRQHGSSSVEVADFEGFVDLVVQLASDR